MTCHQEFLQSQAPIASTDACSMLRVGQSARPQSAARLCALSAARASSYSRHRTPRPRKGHHDLSYSKKVFIPLTTLCRDYCSYCTFRKDPGQPGAHFMTPGRSAGACRTRPRRRLQGSALQPRRSTRAHFSGSSRISAQQGFTRTLDYLAAMCELVLERTGLLPHANPGVMDRRCTCSPQGFQRQRRPDARKRQPAPHARRPCRTRKRPTRCRRSACAPSKKPASSRWLSRREF